jgi:hypothetical protein
MKWFLDLTTRGKLFAGFGVMIVILAIVIATAYYGIAAIQASKASTGNSPMLDLMTFVRTKQSAGRIAEHDGGNATLRPGDLSGNQGVQATRRHGATLLTQSRNVNVCPTGSRM